MNKIIAILDKEYPPCHSFVDGMLTTILPQEKDIKLDLIVSKSDSFKVCRYKKATCLALLYPRRGIYRLLNIAKVFFLINILKKKNKEKKICLFVRNDPLFLLTCTFVKNKNIKLIFQSSFPHEVISGNFFKRFIAKMIYEISKNKVDSLLAVSPKGLIRLKNLMPNVKKAEFIPLLSNKNPKVINFELADKNEKVKFIYAGDHSKLRKLEVVIYAIIKSINKGLFAEFKFIGGEQTDIIRLSNLPGAEKLIKKGILTFTQKIPRNNLIDCYTNFDVGLCLIPPDKHYVEASPTKLTEYLNSGLAVLASKGIELQEKIIENSQAGLLCNWDVHSIANALIGISANKQNLLNMKKKGFKYSNEILSYKNYVDIFKKLLVP